MPGPATTRRWRERLGWPVLLSTGWAVLYTALVVWRRTLRDPEVTTVTYLFSSQHLSHPLGWLFGVALAFTLVGAALTAYALLAGH